MNKGLEALEYLKNKGMIHNNAISRGCIEDIEKELKALEIIKRRLIDMQDLIITMTFSSFNQRRTLRGLLPITKEEYELLKEVFYE